MRVRVTRTGIPTFTCRLSEAIISWPEIEAWAKTAEPRDVGHFGGETEMYVEMLLPKAGPHGSCPTCDEPLVFVGSAGIVDPDDRWDVEATRYRCEGGHMVFVADAERIDAGEVEAAKEDRDTETWDPLKEEPEDE